MSEDLPSPSAEQPQELPATRSIDYPSLEQPGTEIGPYRLLEVLGEGAFGVVYLASQSSPVRRRVALKIIKPGMDSRQVLARFEAERQALAMMDHPSIARVFDAGATEKGRPYFAMELVKGVPITDYCDRHNLAVPQRLELLISACQAVQHAHQKGVIHRDIKPSNVLVTLQDGKPTPKVIDFGVAKATSEPLTERTLFTRQGQLVGTPGYMSPEQAEMSALDVDTRTDIYSLGTLLYELLAGSPPFENDELRHAGLAKIQQIIREVEPPRPSTRCSTLGDEADRAAKRRGSTPQVLARQLRGDLDWITMKALEKDRTRRYASAEAFAEDVRRHLAHQPVEAGPPSATYRLKKFMRRHRAGVAAGITIALLLVASTAVSLGLFWQAKRAEQQQRTAEQAARASARREAAAADEARGAAETAQRALYANQIILASRELDAGKVNVARRLLDAAPPEMRGWEWHHLDGLCDCSLRTLTGHSSWVRTVAFSPDGKRVVSGSWDKTVRVWDFLAGREVGRMQHGEIVECVRFSPDGNRIASGGHNGSLKIWDAGRGKELLRLPGHDGGVLSVRFSPDGKWLFSAGSDKIIRTWDALTGEETETLRGHEKRILNLALGPDGRWLASGGLDGELKVWDIGAKKLKSTLRGETGNIEGLAWDPGGRRLVSRTGAGIITIWDTRTWGPLRTFADLAKGDGAALFAADGEIVVTAAKTMLSLWDVGTGQRIATLCGHQQYISGTCTALSPDGRFIASGGWDQKVKLWDLLACRRRTTAIHAKQGWLHSVAFSPTGNRLVSAGQHSLVRLWDLETCENILTLKGPGKTFDCVAISPDGNRIAAGGEDKIVSLWNLRDPNARTDLSGHDDRVMGIAFSPDSRRLASAGKDRSVKIWDCQTGRNLLTLKGHTGSIRNVTFSPDGRWTVSVGEDSTVRVWNARSGREIHTLQGHRRGSGLRAVAFSRDGRYLASGGSDQTIILWDAKSFDRLRTFRGHSELINSLAFSPDGTRLVSGGEDNSIRLWNVATGEEVLTRYCNDFVNCVAFGPDGRRIAAAGRDLLIRIYYSCSRDDDLQGDKVGRHALYASRIDRTARACETGNTAVARSLLDSCPMDMRGWEWHHLRHACDWPRESFGDAGESLAIRTGQGPVYCLAASPDGKHIASLGRDNVKLWDAVTGRPIRILMVSGDSSWGTVTFRRDGKLLAATSGNDVAVWDVASGALRAELAGHEKKAVGAAFSPDGRRLVTGSMDGKIIVWDIGDGRRLKTPGGHGGGWGVDPVRFSPDGRWIISGGHDQLVKTWDAQTYDLVAELPGHKPWVTNLAISEDSRRVAAACQDGTIKLWDARSHRIIATLLGHAHPVDSIAFSPDGRRLASASQDGTVRLWEPTGGHEVFRKRLGGGVLAVTFSPDGRRLVAGGTDGVIRIFDSGLRDHGPKAAVAGPDAPPVTRIKRAVRKAAEAVAPVVPDPRTTTRPAVPATWDANDGPVVACDGFEGKLALPWKILRPDPSHYSLTARRGFLTVTTQKRGTGASDCRNVFLLPNPCGPGGNYQITTCLAGYHPRDAGQRAGIVVHNDDVNCLRWVLVGGKSHPHLVSEHAGSSLYRLGYSCVLDPPGKLWLRLAKRGGRYAFSSSSDGITYEDHHLVAWRPGPAQRVGLLASNGQDPNTPEIEAAFDFVEVRRLPDTSPNEPPRPFFIPKAYLSVPEAGEECVKKLRRIHEAIRKYQKDHRDLPGELADLVPKYLPAEALVCPDASATAATNGGKLRCTYSWEFSRNRSPGLRQVKEVHFFRDWKLLQLRLFGHVLPLVRCQHKDLGFLNLSWGGQVYRSGSIWEWMFWAGYHYEIDLRRAMDLPPYGGAPGEGLTSRRAVEPQTKPSEPRTRPAKTRPAAGARPGERTEKQPGG